MAEISHLLRSGGITCARVATLSVSSRAEALAKTGEVFPPDCYLDHSRMLVEKHPEHTGNHKRH
jgi:hypothetical protein